ncbi:MAG TPA: VOC family protein [Xanthobacteraceae bacterium]|nr:VOC family protein [Xanthobacteraceae bacterium]
MTLPQTNFDPPFNITRASHLVFTVRDLGASRAFYTEVLGLIVSDEDAGTLWLRGVEERCHHSLTLKKTAGEPLCERVGFRVFSDADLEKAKAHFARAGTAAEWVEVPHQGRTLHVSDAAGTPLELCARMETRPRMHTHLHEHKGGRALRMDHYQVIVPDVPAAAKFYMDLGFRISDYICVDGTDRMVGVFLHRKNNPWDMVFLHRAGPRFHHFGYVVESVHDMFRAFDVAGNIGFADAIEHGPGRHGHSHSYYTYLRDPDGHRCELLLPAIQLIDIDEEPQRYTVTPGRNSNRWGLPAPRSWIEEATNFAGVTIARPAVEGTPFTLERYLEAKAAAASLPRERVA